MEQYLIDTNAISHYLSGRINANNIDFMDNVIDAVPNLSIISKIELLSWKTEEVIEEKIQALLNESNILDISDAIVLDCVAIRRKHKIKTPDAIIAATALTYNFTLVTNNYSDFQNIKGLKVFNPS